MPEQSAAVRAEPWPGTWVRDALGVDLTDVEPAPAWPVRELAGIAVRDNPRRVHLLVSPVLAKHVPARPDAVLGAGADLGRVVSAALGGRAPDLVLGYAETATGLGHTVAATLRAPYLHSTRRAALPGQDPVSFEEEHSHATSHRLLPDDPRFLDGDGPVVLVDDELTTGRTALNTVRALHRAGRDHYVIAALLDLRSAEDVAATGAVAADLGVRIDVVALGHGQVDLPADILARGRSLVAGLDPRVEPTATGPKPRRLGATWPAGVPHHGRHGITATDHAATEEAVRGFGAAVAAELGAGPVHVLGTEELMFLPVLLAGELAAAWPDEAVTCSSTTRSPVVVVDDAGYPIRSSIRFRPHDGTDSAARHAYNLRGLPRIVVVLDEDGDTPDLDADDGLLTRLAGLGAEVFVLVVPSRTVRLPDPLLGPDFGSYPREDVSWLLTDLSDVTLEAPAEEREEAIQSGAGHYAESLPIEYVPSEEYQVLYAEALAASAARVARCAGVVAELALAARGPGIVLASLARAGTPVGVLMRRWLQERHGLDVPHYTLSIVRGRGVDELALTYLAEHHDTASVMFVDGWTGKGMITRELADALVLANTRLGAAFSAELAVLADTGYCVELFGTRDDFLIPSACLNSTVSGLVSRTVLNADLIGPSDFHGAKFYAGLAHADVSNDFIAAVQAEFGAVAADVEADLAMLRASDRTPTWSGRAIVADIGARFGIADENLIKPGVGETTRVLLRRVPWKVLVRAGAADQVPHVLRLAAERGVPVVEVPDLGYTTIGLIRPRDVR